MVHTQRLEDMVLEIGVEWLAGGALDNVACKARPIIGISRRRAGRIDPRRDPLLEQRVIRQFRRTLGDEVLDRLLETRRVGHQVEGRDRLALVGRNLEVDIFVDVGVEVDLALLLLLHQRRPGEQLGDRSRAEQRRLGIDLGFLFEVGIAKAALGQHLAVLDHDHDCTRDIAPADRIWHEAVEPCVDVVRG
jgi:hypothetical protein